MGKISNPVTSTAASPPAARGTKRFQDSGQPATVTGSLPGDEYLNLTNGDLYIKNSDDATWSFGVNLRGPKGVDSTVPGPASTVPGPAGQSTYDAWKSLGGSGTLQDFINAQKVKGDPGTPGANPLIVSGLTGGTAGNFVLRVAGTNTCVDAHPSMKDELRRGLLYWKAPDGTYYAPGGTVPGFTGLTPGHYVALSGKTTATGRNWTTFAGDIPVMLDATATQMYVEIGSTETDTLVRFQPRPAYGEADTGTTYTQTTWSEYALNTNGVLAGVFDDIWTPSNSLRVVADAAYAGGRAAHQAQGSTSARRFLAYKPHGQFRDGQILAVGMMLFAPTKIVQVALRGSGPAGAETAIVCQVDGSNSTFKILAFVNGTANTLSGVGISTVNENIQYAMQLDAKGTRIRARVWVRGQAVPEYTEVYSDLVMTDGFAGMSGRTGDSYFPAVGIVKGYGDIAPTVIG